MPLMITAIGLFILFFAEGFLYLEHTEEEEQSVRRYYQVEHAKRCGTDSYLDRL